MIKNLKNKDVIKELENFPILKDILGRSTNARKESEISRVIQNSKRDDDELKNCLNWIGGIESLLQFGIDNLEAESNSVW